MLRLFRVTLEVGDLEGARNYYGALLGERPHPVGGGRAYLDCGGVILTLLSTGDAPKPGPQDVYFEVDDLEACHRRAAELDCLTQVEVHGEAGGAIVTRPWGERSFYAEDPWGNGLCFVQTGTIFTGE